MDFTQAIRERRERGVLRSLAVLEAYDASDAATRATLLQIAAKTLSDARVTGRLIALLACEQDQGQRQRILTHLAELDFRQVPRNSDCIAHLLNCLQQPDTREWALYCLARMAPRDPQIVAPLIAAYRSQRHDKFARRILASLLLLGNPSAELLAFFATLLDEVDEDFKISLVNQLLAQDALNSDALEKLLAPSEPSYIKVQVLDHLVDRSILLEKPAVELLRRDPDPPCRYAAAWALTETGAVSPEAFDALLQAAGSDPDERVREFSIGTFEHTLAKTPSAITGLLNGLRLETSLPRASLILKLIAPHAYRDPQIVTALESMLEGNLQTDIALEMYALLGVLAPWNESVRSWLVDAFSREKEDRIKVAILRPLSKLLGEDSRISGLCADAIKLPDPEIQQWGLQAILLLPHTPENATAIVDSASLLLSPDVDLDLRVRLAQKLALLPQKSAALLNRLKEVAAQSRDSQLRKICEEVGNNALTDKIGAPNADDATVDWAEWTHRAEIEHRADGIFPAMYEHYDDDPAAARRVLKALLNPQCSASLYSSYGYDVSDHSILSLLDRKNAIDDDISRFCIGRVLIQDAGSPNGYLEFLPSNPAFGPLKDSLWPIIEKRQDANAALLRSLLVSAHGDEDAAAKALSARIATIRGPDALLPYIRLLNENLGWPPSRELLIGLSTHPDLTGDGLVTVAGALKKLGVKGQVPGAQAVQKQGPGFADD